MDHDARLAAFFLAAAMCACQPATAPSTALPKVVPTASAAASVATSPPARRSTSTSAGLCASLAQHNESVLAHPTGTCPGDEKNEPSTRAKMLKLEDKADFLHYCHAGHGTWGVMLVSATLGISDGNIGGCGWLANYKLVYQPDASVPLAACAASPARVWSAFADLESAVTDIRAFDYNGDGRDELIVSTEQRAPQEGMESKVEVLRADGARVTPYEVGFPYDGVIDADNDGRPDLLQGNFFHTPGACSRGTQAINGLPLLLHSLPNGTFSRTDNVARSWAVTECPTATPSSKPEDRCAAQASCQRLWGASVSQIQHWASGSPSCDEDCIKADVAKDFSSPPLPFKPLNVDPPTRLAHPVMITATPERE